MVNVEFISQTDNNTLIENVIISNSLAGCLLNIEIVQTDGDFSVEVFNLMNESESIFVNEFMVGDA